MNLCAKIELLFLYSNAWNHLTVCKWMNSYQQNAHKSYIYTYIYKQNLTLNNWCGPNLGPWKDNSEHGLV